MNTLRNFLFAAIGCLSWTAPALAVPDETLGMALMMAKVNADGTLRAGSGTVSSAKVANGIYTVGFNRNIDDCALSGSVGGVVQQSFPGVSQISTNYSDTVPNGVAIQVVNADGMFVNKPFHLIVFCPK